jgi:hypothetical protein
MKQALQQGLIQIMELLAQPETAGKRFFHVKPKVSSVIELKSEAKLDNEERMGDKKMAKLGGITEEWRIRKR